MPITYWFVNLVGLAAVTYLLLRIRTKTRSFVAHAHLFSIIWGATLLISQTLLDGLIRPDISTILVLYGAWCAFLLSGLIPLSHGRSIVGQSSIKKGPGMFILFGLLVLQAAGVLYEIETLGLRSSSSALFTQLVDLRLSGAFFNVELPLFLSTFRWDHTLYIPLGMLLFANGHISRRFLGVILGIAVFASLLHFTRAPLIQLILVSLVSWLMIFRPRRRAIALGFGVLLLSTVFFFISTQDAIFNSSRRTSVAVARSSLGESLLSYVGLSPRAYETILLGEYPRQDGLYTLDAVYFVLNKMSPMSYPGLDRPYISYPLVTNLYTFLDVFTLDFGIIGAFVGAGIIGLASSWFYVRAKFAPNLFNIVVYAYLSYACVMAPANNEFIRFGFVLSAGLAWLIYRFVRSDRDTTHVSRLVAKND